MKDNRNLYSWGTALIFAVIGLCELTAARGQGFSVREDTAGFRSPGYYPGYRLVWHDEFNEDTLNLRDWVAETGGHGWGNHELEYYTGRPQNVFLSGGLLVIVARKEDYGGRHYTSARIKTQGRRQSTYGRADIRARLPVAPGLWPALWMLGANIDTVSWPRCGEMDIMEVIGKHPRTVVGSFHWQKADGSEGTFNNRHQLRRGDFSDQFHVFSLIWRRDSLKILVDNLPYVAASRKDLSGGPYPFDSPFFFIFNVAVGGDWPGPPGETTPFPQRMLVDYVRVFQQD